MTVTDRIFQKVAEISIPHFFVTVEFAAMGSEMPQGIETFLQEKHKAILRGANGRKFIYREGEWRLIFTFSLRIEWLMNAMPSRIKPLSIQKRNKTCCHLSHFGT